MRIKARLLLPRKELDASGNEIDPRQELIDKILEYKKFKEAAVKMAEMEAERMLMIKRGNLQKELSLLGEEAAEGTEIQNITLFKLMKSFEKVMQRVQDRQNRPVHTVVPYNYTMEGSRDYILDLLSREKMVSFEKIFEVCDNKIHAIFLFLSILELAQQKYMRLSVGSGMNNFIVEWNENREADLEAEAIARLEDAAADATSTEEMTAE
jgi:segregation and condensation protein A